MQEAARKDIEALAPAVELACACCMWPPSARRDERVRAAAAHVDWERFLRVAARQRVQGLAQAALSAAGVRPPNDAGAALKDAARAISVRGLMVAAESVRLQGRFEAVGVAPVFVKGAALAELAYGSLSLKHSRDIDVLVAPADAERALALLEAEGYALVAPRGPLTPAQRRIVLRQHKDIELWSPERRQSVELHWRLVDNPALLAGVGVGSPKQAVAVLKGRLTTLADAELFAYLCVHGATHAWFRLKWLADLGAWLAGKTPGEILALHAAAERLGVGDCAGQALRLCRDLLGLALPPDLGPALDAPRVRRLAAGALDAMAGGEGELELEQRRFGPFRLLPMQFARGRGARFVAAQIGLLVDSVDDRIEVPLPPALSFLYPVLRLPLWLARVRRRRRAGLAASPPA
ncbi:MAG TPA: nucleotidyltransferase family protein [Caulobacteraceae bacterium]|nr:nucleotidyltransferase family protein [Caulobacteraceae bacterium]